ncbi:MAG: C-GCAxxG-C-C family protein [Candidatus Thorarchaeota archaeon]
MPDGANSYVLSISIQSMPSDLSNKAKKLMEEQRDHCAQAIFATYAEHLDSGKVDFETSMKISSAFSGGVARTGNICGAVTGALMVLGLKYGGSPMEAKVNEAAVKLMDEFNAMNRTTICRELIDHDLRSDADVKRAFEVGAFKNCPKYVEDVSEILDKML